jgi:hypothetical protein
MKTIYKYPLQLADGAQEVKMPKGAHLVHVDLQHGDPTLWAEVDTEAASEVRLFQVHGTGHPIKHDGNYVGTAVGVPFVWHVYEFRL